jgi:hypothetical protein
MMLRQGLILILILLSLARLCLAQSGCNVLDKNNSPLYISYERVQELIPKDKKKPERQVVLRLNNNTNCSIFISLYDEPSNNKLTYGSIIPLDNGAVIPLDYKIFDLSGDPGVFLNPPGAADVRWTAELKGNQSVLFIAPLKHFKVNSQLEVRFDYSWDINSGQKGLRSTRKFTNVRHDILFYTWFLPSELFQKKKK